jgi:hypothetical protein
MKQSIIHVAIVVRDYDEAIEFYCGRLHFTLVEDTYQPEQDKRWVVVKPPGSNETSLLLARAATPEQERFIGQHLGGGYFSSCVQMIFGEITTRCSQRGSISYGHQKKPLMAQWLFSKICMAISGIWSKENE